MLKTITLKWFLLALLLLGILTASFYFLYQQRVKNGSLYSVSNFKVVNNNPKLSVFVLTPNNWQLIYDQVSQEAELWKYDTITYEVTNVVPTQGKKNNWQAGSGEMVTYSAYDVIFKNDGKDLIILSYLNIDAMQNQNWSAGLINGELETNLYEGLYASKSKNLDFVEPKAKELRDFLQSQEASSLILGRVL